MEKYIWRAQVNVAVWEVTSGYAEGQLVGTGECGVMGSFERLYRGTDVGHWCMWRYGLCLAAM